LALDTVSSAIRQMKAAAARDIVYLRYRIGR
jgi:hypothetical protein